MPNRVVPRRMDDNAWQFTGSETDAQYMRQWLARITEPSAYHQRIHILDSSLDEPVRVRLMDEYSFASWAISKGDWIVIDDQGKAQKYSAEDFELNFIDVTRVSKESAENSKERQDLIDRLKSASTAVYLATAEDVATDISNMMKQAAEELERM